MKSTRFFDGRGDGIKTGVFRNLSVKPAGKRRDSNTRCRDRNSRDFLPSSRKRDGKRLKLKSANKIPPRIWIRARIRRKAILSLSTLFLSLSLSLSLSPPDLTHNIYFRSRYNACAACARERRIPMYVDKTRRG